MLEAKVKDLALLRLREQLAARGVAAEEAHAPIGPIWRPARRAAWEHHAVRAGELDVACCRTVDATALITLDGELDVGSVGAVREEVEAARRDGRTVTLDLAAVGFIDSAGLTLLVRLAEAASREGGGFTVTRPSAPVTRLLELTGTASRLPVAPT